MPNYWGRFVYLLLSIFLSLSVITAQSLCPELVEDALATVEFNCNALGRNEACYGYNLVEANFFTEVAEDFFTEPASIAAVAEIESLRTAPLDTEANTWGIAMLQVQANLPNTLPGQNLTFILMGDVAIENAVNPEEAFQVNEGVEVRVNSASGANLRSGPSTTSNVIAGAINGDTILVDAISEDGEWLRTVARNRPAWINRSLVDDSNPALRDLPTLSPELRSPMQAFYLQTGIGQPECSEALDNLLLVQGPENIEIDISVNGANIRLGSTGILRTVEEGEEEFLEILVLDGVFEVDGQRILQGQHSFICLEENANGNPVASCPASTPQTIDRSTFGETWCSAEAIPASLLHYPIEVLCVGESIVNTNTAQSGASQSQLPNVSCNNFALISPLFPVNSGTHTFSWTAVEGEAIRYDLVFYNNEGQEVNVFSTSESSYSLNLGAETATGGGFAWEVRAFSNGQYACVTARSPELMRTGELDGRGNPQANNNPNQTSFTATLTGCSQNFALNWVATASFSNASNGGLVSLTGTQGSAPPNTITNFSFGPSGNVSITDSVGLSNIVITDVDTGQSINLPNCP